MKKQKPVIVAGIDLTKKYRIEEVLEMHAKGMLKPIGLQGWIVRADADGLVGFVPWTESTLYRSEHGGTMTHVSEDYSEALRKDVEEQHPMSRRTPQERVAAMMVRMMGTAAEHGGQLPGLTTEQVRAITGESWRQGEPLSATAVQAVAAHFLNIAQNQNRAHNKKKITHDHAFA